MVYIGFFCSLFILISGCQSFTSNEEIKNKLISHYNFKQLVIPNLVFNVDAWAILSPDTDKLVIYIEGDGRAWQTRFKLSEDPTPSKPIALELSGLDSSDNVLYLSRPCQYASLMDSKCQTDKRYWSSHRYSLEVVQFYSHLLDQLKIVYGFKSFELVGYSGGGVIASLVASSRTDVTRLTTIAANLDHENWSKYHNISPLIGSLSLYSYLVPLANITQFHFSGKNDTIVPQSINDGLIRELKKLNPDHVHQIRIDDYDHSCCWSDNWDKMLKIHR